IFNQTLNLQIESQGIPFNPFQKMEPDTTLSIEDRNIGGLGILLVKNLVDDFDYRWRNNKNIVSLVKNLNK
ncbi:ATP-binding protein, partial [Akkermansiaceae bacterium]|nr:ATP-binding protein [Akkermansiaceae bacterium]